MQTYLQINAMFYLILYSRKAAEILQITKHSTDLKDGSTLDFYVAGLWWAKEQGYNLEQMSGFFTVLHTLLGNVKGIYMLQISPFYVVLQQALNDPFPCHWVSTSFRSVSVISCKIWTQFYVAKAIYNDVLSPGARCIKMYKEDSRRFTY